MPPDDTPRGPRPFWSGTIAFGLISLPVSLFVANRSSRVSLRMIDDSGTSLNRRYFCEADDRALTAADIVRGYEVEKDRFVVVEDKELDALAPEKSQEIDLRRFVPLSDIEPMYFERAYFLAPDKGAIKAYRLLARSMEDERRAGVATFVMRGKQYLVAIIAEKGILRAETLRFHDELRSPAAVGLPEPRQADDARVRRFRKAMKPRSRKSLDRDELSDRYSRNVRERVRRKLEAGEDVLEAPEPEAEEEGGEKVVDLMQVLKESLQQEEAPAEAKQATKRASGANRKTKPRRTGGRRKAALAELSKDELYRRAKQQRVTGRSGMTKAELVAAIEAGQGGGRRGCCAATASRATAAPRPAAKRR